MQNELLQIEKNLIEENKYEILRMNVDKAFKTLKCNTLEKKWNYKLQYRELSLLAHSANNRSAEMEIFSADYFLDSYYKKLKVFSYQTTKIFLLWAFFIFLKNFLQRKKKSSNKQSPPDAPKTLRGDRKIIDLIINSFSFFVNSSFLLWWILSLQKLLGTNL